MAKFAYKKRFTINGIDPEKVKQAAAAIGKSPTDYAKELLEKAMSGEVVATGTVINGKEGKHCIQPLQDYPKPEECPFRIEYPELQKAENGLTLQEKFCTKCLYYKKDFKTFEHNLKQKAKEIQDNPPPKPAPKVLKILDFTVRCKQNACDKRWQSLDYQDRRDPLMEMNRMIALHVKGFHGLDYVPPELSPYRAAEKVKQEMQGA